MKRYVASGRPRTTYPRTTYEIARLYTKSDRKAKAMVRWAEKLVDSIMGEKKR